MALVEWRPEFEIGNAAVDHEHREMIDLLNRLHERLEPEGRGGGANPDIVAEFLGEVFATISAHFALEERVMRQRGYDQFAAHKAEHERLLDEIRDIMERHERGGYDRLEADLSDQLQAWFIGHFSSMDARLHKEL